jgi:hypothetical protein
MAQLSRPYQIALGALVLLALVWFVALRGHSTSSSPTPAASAPSSAGAPAAGSSAAAQAKAAAAPTPIYHGAAPGVEGLTRAIDKAHEAVATSQRQAHKLEGSSAQATGQGAPGAGANTSTKGSTRTAVPTSATAPATKASATAPATKGAAPTTGKPRPAAAGGTPARQAAVERELKQGKVVLVLFWDPKGADDVTVRKELEAVGRKLGRKVAVHDALANQVGLFGSITRAIQVYQTPTILFVNGKGLTTTLTGFTDAFSIEQTIDEARKA